MIIGLRTAQVTSQNPGVKSQQSHEQQRAAVRAQTNTLKLLRLSPHNWYNSEEKEERDCQHSAGLIHQTIPLPTRYLFLWLRDINPLFSLVINFHNWLY